MSLIDNFNDIEICPSEIEKFEKFLKLKGVQRHRLLLESIINKTSEKANINILSEHYRYDVKLRRAVFKSMALLEVALKAAICNNNEIKVISKQQAIEVIEKYFNCEIKDKRIFRRKIPIIFDNDKELSLFEFLERSDMDVLIKIFMLLPKESHRELFGESDHLFENLMALKTLRNKVFHHNILLNSNLETVFLEGNKKSGLKANLRNMVNFISENARYNTMVELNRCLFKNEEEKSFFDIVEEYKIVFEEAGYEFKKN